MRQLGDHITTESAESRKIKTILAARRALYQAGVQLLECDDAYAGRIKAELERQVFASHSVSFADGKQIERELDASGVRFYLEIFMRIYVQEESVEIDRENALCRIRLNERTEAVIKIQSGRAVKSILLRDAPAENLRETEEYKSGMYTIVTCPVCGRETLDMYWICRHCGWEYDGTKKEDEYSSANHATVKEYRETYCKDS